MDTIRFDRLAAKGYHTGMTSAASLDSFLTHSAHLELADADADVLVT